ncbi:MAG: GntR family transcriptional regulator [Oscillospiraceae bacterium]|nr:GntR family transcriptional regulator [Oscillospiraceae bacterium]
MLNRETSKPLYAQARDILLERIESEEYLPNTKIPSESELCAEFGISRMTVRSVITELVRDGRLYRIQGKGTFVAEPKIMTSGTGYVGIREQLEKQGYEVKTEVVEFSSLSCPPSLAKKMELSPGEMVYKLIRLRSVRDEPFSMHTSYIPLSRCPELDKKDVCSEQLCAVLDEEYGLKRASVSETLESALATESEAKFLGIKRGYPLILLRDKIYDADGRIFEYSSVVFRGDKMKIHLEYNS